MMGINRKTKLISSFVIAVMIFDLDVIHCCSGGSSDEPTTKAPDAYTMDPDQCGEDKEMTEGGGMIDESEDKMLPKFSWDMDESNMTEGPFLLKIEYPEDGYTDVAILFPAYNKSDRSILSGEMMKENASVAVNGNPNDKTFDIAMHSDHHRGGVYQVKEGKTNEVAYDPCLTDGEAEMMSNETNDGAYESEDYALNSGGGAPSSFTITLSLHYDRLFLRNVAGGSQATAQRKIREIVNLAGPVFKSQSYRLGHQITLQEVNIGFVDDDFKLSGNNVGPNIRRAGATNSRQSQDADNYHYFTHDTRGGVSGVAYLGTVCSSTKALRTGISEWIGSANSRRSELQCMLTFAHELGHSLNMPHDFCNDPQCRQGTAKIHPRRDSRGQPCWNQNSVMDYFQGSVNKWSTCSKEAMNRLNFGTQRCNSKGGTTNPNCQDNQRSLYYCINRNNFNWGGCDGRYRNYFRQNCRRSCNLC